MPRSLLSLPLLGALVCVCSCTNQMPERKPKADDETAWMPDIEELLNEGAGGIPLSDHRQESFQNQGFGSYCFDTVIDFRPSPESKFNNGQTYEILTAIHSDARSILENSELHSPNAHRVIEEAYRRAAEKEMARLARTSLKVEIRVVVSNLRRISE